MNYGVSRTGDGKYYIVNVEDREASKPYYVGGELLTFEFAEDAKAYIIENLSNLITRKLRRV